MICHTRGRNVYDGIIYNDVLINKFINTSWSTATGRWGEFITKSRDKLLLEEFILPRSPRHYAQEIRTQKVSR